MRSITIQLTKNCMLKCPYCFAGNKLSEYISDDVLDTIKEFVERNQIPLIRITGGEPFLYDKCVDVINYFSENSIDLKVFSNLCVENCFDGITYPHKIIVLANINYCSFYSSNQLNIIESNLLSALKSGIRIILGRTYYEYSFDIEDLVELAKKFNVTTLRVSPANPTINAENYYMDSYQINDLMTYLMKKQMELDKLGIIIKFDCPISPCIVNPDVYSFFEKRKQLTYKCGRRIVVCTDGSLEHCYVTSPIVKLHINQFNTYEEIESCIKQKLREYSLSCFNNEKCIGCSYYSEIPCGCFGLHSRLNEMQGIK